MESEVYWANIGTYISYYTIKFEKEKNIARKLQLISYTHFL